MNLITRAGLVRKCNAYSRTADAEFTRENRSRQTPGKGGFNSRPKAKSILGRDDERLDHLGFGEVATELIQLC